MITHTIEYKDYLKKLKKDELTKILKDYNYLAKIYEKEELTTTLNKKDALVEAIDGVKNEYIKFLIMSLDLKDFSSITKILGKRVKKEILDECKELIKYLLQKRVLWQEDDLAITEDIYRIVKKTIKDKSVVRYVKIWDNNYKYVAGIIIAYGVVDRGYFDILISGLKNNNHLIEKLDFYYKRDYKITAKMLTSNKLTNKKKIDKYLKDINYKEFNYKDFMALGSSTYHHSIKSFKRLIKVLNNNYVFNKNDILFVDENVVIPYLYNSLNEEDIANKKLGETITSLFEFKGNKLKEKMLVSIKEIREEFPLWEYRGFSKLEERK